MSSSRSVAAARARRAGGDSSSIRPSQQQTAPAQYAKAQQQSGKTRQDSTDQTQQGDGRLSVSDAFALVTIRLGRVEMALQKLDIHNIAKNVADGESAGSTASNVIMKSVVSRIDDLEKSIDNKLGMVDGQNEQTDMIISLQDKLRSMENELKDAKDAIYKLQSFALDMNQKIVAKDLPIPGPPVIKDTTPPSTTEVDECESGGEQEKDIDSAGADEPIENNIDDETVVVSDGAEQDTQVDAEGTDDA